MAHDYLTFSLGEEDFGIPILNVQEIIGYQESTPVPHAPAWMSGVINIRGQVIPVVDIRSKLGMCPGDYGDTSVIIVHRVGRRIIGAVVDAVNDVAGFPDDRIQAATTVSAQLKDGCVTGVGRLDDRRLVMLLDMCHLLDDDLDGLDSGEGDIDMG